MEKVKIHPFIILALLMSSISMGMYAYRNFNNQETAYGIFFTLLSTFLIGLVVFGIIGNRKIENEKNK